MKYGLLWVLGAALLTACEGGGDASCSLCQQSFTNAQCMAIAQRHGCTSGRAVQDTVCSPPTQGCAFQGCPPGPVTCDGTTGDSGAVDSGTDAATE